MQNEWIINCPGSSLCSSHPWGILATDGVLETENDEMNTGSAASAWIFMIIPHHLLSIIPLLLKRTSKAHNLWHMWWWYVSNNAHNVITCNFNGISGSDTRPACITVAVKESLVWDTNIWNEQMYKIWRVLIEPLEHSWIKKDVHYSIQWKCLKLFRPWKLSSTFRKNSSVTTPSIATQPLSTTLLPRSLSQVLPIQLSQQRACSPALSACNGYLGIDPA